MTCAGCGETEADGAIFESADGRCFRCNRPALQIPNAEVKAPPPKRRPKCGPSLSKTRSAEEAAAHAIKMRQLPATEKKVYATRSALWAAASQVLFEEYRQKEEKRTREEVRPDFAVCCAGVTVRRDNLAASQKLRREQERAAAWAASRPDFVVLLCRRDEF